MTLDQAAMDSALMFARDAFRASADAEGRRMLAQRESDELNRKAMSALAPLNNRMARLMREINRDLDAWYTGLIMPGNPPPWDRHKHDSAPRMDWGTVESSWDSGFRASYRYDAETADCAVSARFYSHRWRVTLARELHSADIGEIESFLRTLAISGKAAVEALYRTAAPSWMDHQKGSTP